MDWLYRYDFDTLTLIAVWCLAGVLVTTVVLFFYAIGLRTATVIRNRRRDAFVHRWREVFAMAVINRDAAAALPLPIVHRHDETDLLEEWNRVRGLVDGKAIDNLIVLARRTAIRNIAMRKLHHGRLSSRILAVHTLGHLRDSGFQDEFLTLVDHPHTALSITAAEALVEIDPEKRDAMIAEAFRISHENAYYLPLHQQSLAWGVSDKLDLVQRADNQFQFRFVTKN